MRHARGIRGFFSDRMRKRIEDLACEDPATIGWSITHWSQRDLAQAAVEQDYVESIHHAPVGRILLEADLHPHRFRYWKTTIWDEEAVERPLKILAHWELPW